MGNVNEKSNDRINLEDQKGPTHVKWLGVATLLVVVLGGWYWWKQAQFHDDVKYVTEQVEKGGIHVTVSADGTLAPVRTVTIGSELSGIVREVHVDVNDSVTQGQALVTLDTRNLLAKVQQYRAALQSAKANLAQSQASLKEAELKLKRMRKLDRLSQGTMPSRTELESQTATVETVKASVAVSKANVSDAEALLKTAETDLSKAVIKAPIDGVILTRSVEPGYAVAATLQAVELLTLASDLRALELQVAVDEADIGVVKEGQKAFFTVSTYPNKRFPATLRKVAYGATTTENVVTYTAYLNVDNGAMLLRPGMTASATISTADKNDVLLVPNSAFRYQPKLTTQSRGATMPGMMPRRSPHAAGTKKVKELAQHGELQKTLYVLKDNKPVLVNVVTGLTDGLQTEIVSGDLTEGDQVILDQQKGR